LLLIEKYVESEFLDWSALDARRGEGDSDGGVETQHWSPNCPYR